MARMSANRARSSLRSRAWWRQLGWVFGGYLASEFWRNVYEGFGGTRNLQDWMFGIPTMVLSASMGNRGMFIGGGLYSATQATDMVAFGGSALDVGVQRGATSGGQTATPEAY